MRKTLALMLVVLASSFVIVASDSADASASDIMLFEVSPYNDDEGVSLHNYGSTSVYLSDYCVTDNPAKKSGEGIITFDESLVINPGETLTFVKDGEKSWFSDRHPTYVDGGGKVTFSKNFALANSGDDVYLFKGETVIDTFVYGNGKVQEGSLWTGDAFTLKDGNFAGRISSDGFDAHCWFKYIPGGTNIPFDPNLKFDADVTPFLFPESGGIPLYRALEDAKESVYITIYLISSSNVLGLLDKLLEDGVSVHLLLEAAPFNFSKPATDGRLKTLAEDGADIRLIGDVKGDRFDYVHSKYCIIDGRKVVITSENWTAANMDGKTVTDPTQGAGNRGWGAIVESAEYASFMMTAFMNDSDMAYGDVFDFDDVTPGLKPSSLTYSSPTVKYEVDTYRTQITPGLAPDNAYEAEVYYMSAAKDRIYSEQQNITKSFTDFTKESPLKYLNEKASAGVDVKLVLSENVDISIINEINATSLIKTAQMLKPYAHNKGIICDDMVIVTSVNWTENSYANNREILIAIHSKEVTEFFCKAYEGDFDRNYKDSGLTVTFTEIKTHYDSAGEYTVAVEVKQEGTFTYTWNLDGNTRQTDAPRTVLELVKGEHVLTVTVTDKDDNFGKVTASFSVGETEGSDLLSNIGLYLIPIAIVVIAVLIAVMRASGGKR